MQHFFSRAGLALLCVLLTALLIAALFWALSIGTVDLPPRIIAAAILDQIQSGTPIDMAEKGPVHDIAASSRRGRRSSRSRRRRLSR